MPGPNDNIDPLARLERLRLRDGRAVSEPSLRFDERLDATDKTVFGRKRVIQTVHDEVVLEGPLTEEDRKRLFEEERKRFIEAVKGLQNHEVQNPCSEIPLDSIRPKGSPISKMNEEEIRLAEDEILRARRRKSAIDELESALDELASSCPGEGRCHGPQSWCEFCGDTSEMCDDPECHCHSHGKPLEPLPEFDFGFETE